MASSFSENKIVQALNWTYDQAVNGFAGLDSAEQMAEDYLKGEGSLHDQVNSLIRWQYTRAATSGFLTGLGGLMAMPITIPTSVTSVMFVQVRMIAAIAKMGGYDLQDDKVKSLVFACLVGDAAKDVLKDTGIVIGSKMATTAIKNISGTTLTAINQKVGFRLITKFGEKGVINLGKVIPVLGGIIGGTVDLTATNVIGTIARNTFIGVR